MKSDKKKPKKKEKCIIIKFPKKKLKTLSAIKTQKIF